MKKLLYILFTIFTLAAGNNAANANRWGFSTVQAGAAGQWGAKYLGGLIINGAHITSPVLQGAVAGITGGAIGGYVAGFSGGFMMTGDLSAANKAGLNGALVGASVGGISGSVSAYRYAVDNNINPWNGNKLNTSSNNARIVTPDGVALPEGAIIPDNLIENPNRPGSYGVIDINGKFQEVVRIDQATPLGKTGPNKSHFHLNGGKEHIYDTKRWPWWR